MFISEFEKKESLRNVISKIYKSHDAKKKASFKRFPELFEGLDFFNSWGKQFHICVLTTFTKGMFRAQPNIYDGIFCENS